MFCKFCGTQIPDNSEVCPNCNNPIVVTTTVPPVQQPAYQPVDAMPLADEPKKGRKGKKVKEPKDPSKKSKKKIVIPAIALILVVAIVAGVLLIFQNPAVKVFGAVKKTVFESSEIKITVTSHGGDWYEERYGITENMDDIYEIELFFGDNIESSEGTIRTKCKYVDLVYGEYWDDNYDCYMTDYDNVTDYHIYNSEDSYAYKSGKFYEDGEKYDKNLKELSSMGEDWLKEEMDIEIDIIDTVNMIIKGKLDEDGLAEVFNTILVPNIEKVVNKYYDTKLDLPEFEGILGNFEDFLKKAYKDEVLVLEKAKSKNKGTTYEYKLDIEKLAECFLEYVQGEEDLNKYLQYVVDLVKENDEKSGYDNNIDDVEDLVTFLEENIDEIDMEVEGEITISGGRVTYLTIGEDGEEYLTIEIESKK